MSVQNCKRNLQNKISKIHQKQYITLLLSFNLLKSLKSNGKIMAGKHNYVIGKNIYKSTFINKKNSKWGDNILRNLTAASFCQGFAISKDIL